MVQVTLRRTSEANFFTKAYNTVKLIPCALKQAIGNLLPSALPIPRPQQVTSTGLANFCARAPQCCCWTEHELVRLKRPIDQKNLGFYPGRATCA